MCYRDSLNSSGTVSRKTSTASDYTPEHTVGHDTRAHFIDETQVSYSTESCMSVSEQRTKPRDEMAEINSVKQDLQEKPLAENAGDTTDALQTELNNSLKQKEVVLVPGQKVDLKVLILRQDSAVEGAEQIQGAEVVGTGKSEPSAVEKQRDVSSNRTVATGEEKNIDLQEKVSDGQLKVPQRKISRFLVSTYF